MANMSPHRHNENGNQPVDNETTLLNDEQDYSVNDENDQSDSDSTEIESEDENEDDDDEEDEDDEDDNDDNEEEEDDDDEDEEEDENEKINELKQQSSKPPASPGGPTCYICLNEFEGQDIGDPDSCESIHHFCLECIEEWSKQINTCPVDRKLFSFILVRRDLDGEIVMKVPVTKKSVLEIETMEEDLTYCEICGRCDREDRLLLCDGCDFGYHCECLDPPLETIPVDEWFCPECFERIFGDDIRQESYRRQSSRRAIARTGAFEIVRNRILARRTTSANNFTNNNSTRQRSSLNSTRRKTTRTRKRRKTKKNTKTKTRKVTKGTRKRTKRRKTKKGKKRTRKSKLSARRLPSAMVRSRIATKLGLTTKSKSAYGLLSISKPLAATDMRYSAGGSTLSLFGHELDFYDPRCLDEQEFEFDSNFGGIGLLAQARSHISHQICKGVRTPPPVTSADLLSEIMSSQEILHTSSSDLSIARDGRIYLKNETKGTVQKRPDSSSNSQTSSSSSSPSGENSAGNGSNGNNGYFKQPNYSEQLLPESDISSIKPSPVVALLDDKPDIELYSDIESLGDNKDESDKETDERKHNKNSQDGGCNFSTTHSQCAESNSVLLQSNVTMSPDAASNNGNDDATKDPDISGSKESLCDMNCDKKRREPKRRPSIRDLFGGDSDENDDDDLKQIVAQGSINVHFPVKMPIVLKSNVLNKKESMPSNEVPISKKWIPIYPEPEKCKTTGPKWKAFGQSDLAYGKDDPNTNVELSAKLTKDSVLLADNDRKENKSDLKEHTENNSPLFSADRMETVGIVENLHRSPSFEQRSKVSTFTEVKSLHTCKHGRILKRKRKDESKDSKIKRTRSNSPFDDRNKKSKDNINILKESKEHISVKDDSDDSLTWKRLSSSSKMRNYRDGKYKETDFLYKDRSLDIRSRSELQTHDNESRKKSQSGEVTVRKVDTRILSTSKQSSRHEKYDSDTRTTKVPSVVRSLVSKPSNYQSTKESAFDSRGIKKDKERRSSREKSPDVDRYGNVRVHKYHRHESHSNSNQFIKHKTPELEKEECSRETRSHDHDHHSHHRHHHHRHYQHHHYSHKHSQSDNKSKLKCAVSSDAPKGSSHKSSTTTTSHYQPYPVLKTVDSKKIYADGDKIIINVNFKKECTPQPVKVAEDRLMEQSCPVETETFRAKDTTTRSSVEKEQRKCSVSTHSPRNVNSPDIYSSPLDEDYVPSDHSISSPAPATNVNSITLSKYVPPSDDNFNSKAFTEEFNFLPRILQTQETNNASELDSRSPESYLEDSFMPTPTQDESHSPVLPQRLTKSVNPGHSGNHHQASSIRSSSPPETKDDFYDPELPLQSPDRQSISSTKCKRPFESVSSSLESPQTKLEQNSFLSHNSSNFSSSFLAATTALASLKNINLAELIKIAQSFQGQSSNQNGGNSGDRSSAAIKVTQTQSNNNQMTDSNCDIIETVDMELDSPSPSSNSPVQVQAQRPGHVSSPPNVKEIWDRIVKSASVRSIDSGATNEEQQKSSESREQNKQKPKRKFDPNQPITSEEDIKMRAKYIKKLNRLERVVEEVKISLKPHYQARKIHKEEYKAIMRKAVPKIVHNKSREINAAKIQKLIDAYIKQYERKRAKSMKGVNGTGKAITIN